MRRKSPWCPFSNLSHVCWGQSWLKWKIVSSDHLCKQFGPRSGQTECWSWSGSRHSDSVPEMFLKNIILKKVSRRGQHLKKYPPCKDRICTDLEKPLNLILVLENSWNLKKVPFVLELSRNLVKLSLKIWITPWKISNTMSTFGFMGCGKKIARYKLKCEMRLVFYS